MISLDTYKAILAMEGDAGLDGVTRDDGSGAFQEGGSSSGSGLPRRMPFWGSL